MQYSNPIIMIIVTANNHTLQRSFGYSSHWRLINLQHWRCEFSLWSLLSINERRERSRARFPTIGNDDSCLLCVCNNNNNSDKSWYSNNKNKMRRWQREIFFAPVRSPAAAAVFRIYLVARICAKNITPLRMCIFIYDPFLSLCAVAPLSLWERLPPVNQFRMNSYF